MKKLIPHCPNPKCINHNEKTSKINWYRKRGFDYRKFRGKTQRFQCKECLTTFSTSYFSINYYCKHPLSYRKMLNLLCISTGIRAIAGTLKCDPKVVLNRISRLAKKIQGIRSMEEQSLVLNENLCSHGLESFILSHSNPTRNNLLLGCQSQFIYFVNSHYLRRKARILDEQNWVRGKLYQRDEIKLQGSQKAIGELLDRADLLIRKSPHKRMILHRNEWRIYRYLLGKEKPIRQSAAIIYGYSKPFTCKYIRREFRKDLAEFVKETTRFARNRNNSMERIVLYTFYHNYIKPYRVGHPWKKKLRHAQIAGISKCKVRQTLGKVMDGKRLFYPEVEGFLSFSQRKLWNREL